MTKFPILLLTIWFTCNHLHAISLPGGAKLDIFLPENERHPSQCAMLIIPGGSYNGIVMKNEGKLPAKKNNEAGIPAFVLSYHTRTKHPIPLTDAEEAMEYIRSNAEKYRINPKCVGVMGFSAGGHLSATLSTLGKASCLPDFAVLFYPVISMYDSITHRTSRNNIIGADASDSLRELLSCYKQVSASTPPTFISHGEKDGKVPIENSRLYYDALKSAGVLSVFHREPGGVHGYGGNVYSGTTWQKEYPAFFESVLKSKVSIRLKFPGIHRSRRLIVGGMVHETRLTPYFTLLGSIKNGRPAASGVFLKYVGSTSVLGNGPVVPQKMEY